MTTKKAPISFSYGRFIVESKITGLTAMLACHCDPVFYNADIPFIRIEMPPALNGFKESPAMKSFEMSLKSYFGEGLEIEFVNGPAANSPAYKQMNKKLTELKSVHQTIMNDDMIQKMVKDFGAKIIVDSIKPITAPKP